MYARLRPRLPQRKMERESRPMPMQMPAEMKARMIICTGRTWPLVSESKSIASTIASVIAMFQKIWPICGSVSVAVSVSIG